MEKVAKLRQTVYQLLEGKKQGSVGARMVSLSLVILIFANIVAFALETIDEVNTRAASVFFGLFWVSVFIFSVEYVFRIWSITEHPSGKYRQPFWGRLKYAISPLAILDLAVILPFYLSLFGGIDLRLLRIFRLLWLLKLIRYLPAIATIGLVFRRQSRTLVAALVIMVSTLFIASTLMYFAEREIQPEVFASIPQAMWWGVTTLTTVGYGDVVPLSASGRVMGMVIMLLGIAMFALPTAILASAFIEESKRKDFIVTWNLVASVPLFSKLDAAEIAEITQILKPRTAVPNEVLFQRDEKADGMYFIISGQVEAELIPKPKRLGRGEFFGEVGLLQDQRRTATVIARTYSELLELEAAAFYTLLESNPSIKKRVVAVAEKRLARSNE